MMSRKENINKTTKLSVLNAILPLFRSKNIRKTAKLSALILLISSEKTA
jgi:hypothetical protein